MDFDTFLNENNFPHIGEEVTTPAGDRVKIVKYVFDPFGDYVAVRSVYCNGSVIEWTFDQIKQCKREEI